MRRNGSSRLAISGVMVMLVVAALVMIIPAPGSGMAKPIKMGVILELTGPGASYGVPAKQTIELRLEQCHYEVAGRPIKVVWEDDQTSPATAMLKAKKLVELDKVDFILGPIFSHVQDSIAPYLARHHIMGMAPIGASLELKKHANWIVFPGSLYSFGIPLGDYAYGKGYRTMTTLGADYIAGYRFVNGVGDRFKAKGGSVIQQQWVPYGTSDYAPYLTALKKADVFAVWTIAPDMLTILKQYYQLGLKMPILIIEADNLNSSQLAGIGEPLLGTKGMIAAYTQRLDYPSNHDFVKALKAKFGRSPDMIDGCAYTCMSIYLAGLEATKGDPHLGVLRPAILRLKLNTPAGPVSFAPSGFALSNRYMAEVKLIDDKYAWDPFETYTEVRDPRDKVE